MTMERFLLWGLILILAVAPLPFGSVQPRAAAALVVACLALGILWVLWRSRRGLSPLPGKDPVLAVGALFALVGAVQLVPLPETALRLISPKAVELRERYEPRAAGENPSRGRGWQPLSLYPWATRQALLRFIACLIAALVTIDLSGRETWRRTLAMALVASGGFQAVYGLSEYFSGRQHIFGYAKRYYTEVATGTFINRNHFAGYLEMTLPLAIALASLSLARLGGGAGVPITRRLAEASGREMFAASVLLLLALTMAVALVCSQSRMGITSVLLALLSVGLFLAWRGRGRSFALAAVIVAGATLLLVGQGSAAGSVLERFLGTAKEFQGDFGRWSIWAQAAGMLAAFPLFGAGFGSFPYVFPVFRTAAEGASFPHAHNDFLELAAETGAVGCVAALLGLFLIGRALLWRAEGRPGFGHLGYAASAALAAIGFHSLTDFNLAIPSNALTLSVLAGMVICWMRVSAPVLAVDQARQRRWLTRAWAPAGLMAVIAAVAVAPVLAGGSLHSKTGWEEPAAGPSRPDESRAQRLALLLDGDNAERRFRIAGQEGRAALSDLQVLLQTSAEGPGPSPVAMAYIERRLEQAIDHQIGGLRFLPTSSAGHLALGQLELGRCAAAALSGAAQEDCLAQAMPQFRSALQLNPMSAATHSGVARILVASWPLLDAQARSEAASVIERAVALNPGEQDLAATWRGVQAGTGPRLAERLTE